MMISSGPGSKNQRAFPLASEGYPFIAVSILATAVLAILGLGVLALFFLGLTVFIGYFFRDPERVIPQEEGVVVSPADGKIVEVKVAKHSDLAPEEMLKISVFMSVFNVHVNRAPAKATVTDVSYHPGKFIAANLDKASIHNERNAVSFEIDGGQRLIVVQVAGLIARRIVCKIKKGDHLGRGERFGMIRFGSRLDIYLPQDTRPTVAVGDKVLAGTSLLGYLP